MLNAQKLVAVILRLLALVNLLYVGGVVLVAIISPLAGGGPNAVFTASNLVPMLSWAGMSAIVYLCAVPFGRLLARDIDRAD